jgi:hypothetical protein
MVGMGVGREWFDETDRRFIVIEVQQICMIPPIWECFTNKFELFGF